MFPTIHCATARTVASRFLTCREEAPVIVNECPCCRWLLRGSGASVKSLSALLAMADGGDGTHPAVTSSDCARSYALLRAGVAACASTNLLARVPLTRLWEILRVVYNLQPVAFPEGQVRRRPRLVVIERHKRSNASYRKHTFGEQYRLKKTFPIKVHLQKPDFTSVLALDDSLCNFMNLQSSSW